MFAQERALAAAGSSAQRKEPVFAIERMKFVQAIANYFEKFEIKNMTSKN